MLGAVATVLALKVQSVQALWFFTSDLVFVLLFPQLLLALFDPQANRTGSIAAFAVSLVLRVGGGEPLLGVPAAFPYPDDLPFRTIAAGLGLVLLPLVSRLTGPLGSAAAAAQSVDAARRALTAAVHPLTYLGAAGRCRPGKTAPLRAQRAAPDVAWMVHRRARQPSSQPRRQNVGRKVLLVLALIGLVTSHPFAQGSKEEFEAEARLPHRHD